MKRLLEKLHAIFLNGSGEYIEPHHPPHGGTDSNSDTSRESHVTGQNRIRFDLLIHDLKVPLAVIEAGVTSLLNHQEKYGSLADKQVKVLKRALRNTKVTQKLVEDALELGRSERGIMNLSTVQISSLVEDALIEIFDLADSDISEKIKTCGGLEGLRESLQSEGFRLYVDDALWSEKLRLDQAKIKQILRNLLSNALKYRKSVIELRAFREQGSLLLCIKDDGEGIPSKYHQKIFDCYFQMDPGEACPVRGHGLGLAGVMVLVEDIGGEMSLSSDQGQGAEFIVRIPVESC